MTRKTADGLRRAESLDILPVTHAASDNDTQDVERRLNKTGYRSGLETNCVSFATCRTIRSVYIHLGCRDRTAECSSTLVLV
ncbi:unnamed protein product [Leuciscus chuanchicus]